MSNSTTWLTTLADTHSAGKVAFKPSAVGGLGGFALVDLAPGDIVFSIPYELILTSQSNRVLEDAGVKLLEKDLNITLESCLFVYMAEHLKLAKNEYLLTLPKTSLPLVASELSGTNVGSQVVKDNAEMVSQLAKIHALGGHKSLTLAQFVHSKFLYNSRRFPFAFGGLGGERSMVHPRRRYDLTQGSLCPLLDVLNSKAGEKGEPRLSFDVSDPTILQVKTLVAIKKGKELYNDYGCVSNNQSLLQFQYCDKALPAVFTIIVSGVTYDLTALEVLPVQLTGDGGYGLHHHLSTKLKEMKGAKPSSNAEVKWYMRSQCELMNALLGKCDELILEDMQDRVHTEGEEEDGEEAGRDDAAIAQPVLKKRRY